MNNRIYNDMMSFSSLSYKTVCKRQKNKMREIKLKRAEKRELTENA